MDESETKKCAVFGDGLIVMKYRVSVEVVESDKHIGSMVFGKEADLGYRALERLCRKIEQGVTPPAKRAKSDA